MIDFNVSLLAHEPWTASMMPARKAEMLADSETVDSSDAVTAVAEAIPDTVPDRWHQSEMNAASEHWHVSQPLDASDSSHPQSLEGQFRKLAAQWKRESQFMSSPMDMVALPSYLHIMALGKRVVPLLLEELNREMDHWFVALHILTGHNPVSESMAGRVDEMTAAWLKWGQTQGLIHRS